MFEGDKLNKSTREAKRTVWDQILVRSGAQPSQYAQSSITVRQTPEEKKKLTAYHAAVATVHLTGSSVTKKPFLSPSYCSLSSLHLPSGFIAHFQADLESSDPASRSSLATDNDSSTSRSRVDSSSSSGTHLQFSTLQLQANLFKFNPSLPFLDSPPGSNLLQSARDARTDVSCRFVDNVFLNLHGCSDTSNYRSK